MNIWRHLLVRHVWGACSHAIYFSLVTWAKFTYDQHFLLSLNLRSFAGEIRNTPVGPPRLSFHFNQCAKYKNKEKCENVLLFVKTPGWKQTELFNGTAWWKGFIWMVLGLFLVSFVLLLLFCFSCAVYCVHTICWYIQGNLNKEPNNNLGMISAFLILCRIFPLPQ